MAAQPDVLHHQREARARGHGHGLLAAPDRALDGDRGGDLVLHLDEDAARPAGMRAAKRSTTSVDGVIG